MTLMDDFNPGPGWREITQAEWSFHPDDDEDNIVVKIDGIRHRYVREDPVPPLPTEPFTVIRVTWKPLDARQTFEFVRLDGLWRNKHGEVLDPADIASFEVLAEPRAVTAWSVLERVSDMPSVKFVLTSGDFRKVADEFGVES